MRPTRPPVRFAAKETPTATAPADEQNPHTPVAAAAPTASPITAAEQQEELDVLQAIYDADFLHLPATPPFHSCFRVRLAEYLSCEVRLPSTYPSTARPLFLLHVDSPVSYTYLLAQLSEEVPSTGEAIVFQCLDILKERIVAAEQTRVSAVETEEKERRMRQEQEEHASLLAIEAMEIAEKEQRLSAFDEDELLASSSAQSSSRYAAGAAATTVACPSILTGAPLSDRKSTFQAHVATVHTVAETRSVLSALYSNPKIARATHNMWAYVLKEGQIVRRENEDDGEDMAGSRLAHLLQMMAVENLIVVVSRWYGGIKLGADRFKHINNVARAVIEAHLPSAGTKDGVGKDKKSSSHVHANKR